MGDKVVFVNSIMNKIVLLILIFYTILITDLYMVYFNLFYINNIDKE